MQKIRKVNNFKQLCPKHKLDNIPGLHKDFHSKKFTVQFTNVVWKLEILICLGERRYY